MEIKLYGNTLYCPHRIHCHHSVQRPHVFGLQPEPDSRIIVQAVSSISDFQVPLIRLSGFFMEPKGPDSRIPSSNQRIPAGEYRLARHHRELHGGIYRVENPQLLGERGGILFHRGNEPGQTQGCFMPGTNWSSNPMKVSSSGVMLQRLHSSIDVLGLRNIRFNLYNVY